MAVKNWSSTAADNVSGLTGINWNEGMNAAAVNDSARGTLAQIADWYAQIKGGTIYPASIGGTANAITLTCSPTIDAYAAGQRFMFKAGSANTASTTINVDGLGGKTVKYAGADLNGGEWASGDLIIVAYDGTNLQLLFSQRATSSNRILLSNFATLSAADAAASLAGGILVIDKNFTLSGNTSLTSFVQFSGGVITTGTFTLSFAKGWFAPPLKQIFDNSGGGAISSAYSVEIAYSDWWGVATNGSDVADTFQIIANTLPNIGYPTFYIRGGGASYGLSHPTVWSSPLHITSDPSSPANIINLFDTGTYTSSTSSALFMCGFDSSGAITNRTTIGTLTADAPLGIDYLVLSSVTGLAVEDWIAAGDANPGLGTTIAKVKSISTLTTVLDRTTATAALAASPTTVFKIINPSSVRFSNLAFDGNGTTGSPRYGYMIRVYGAIGGTQMENVKTKNHGSVAYEFRACADAIYDNPRARDATDVNPGLGYNFRLSSSNDCYILQPHGFLVRHCVDFNASCRNSCINGRNHLGLGISYLSHQDYGSGNTFINCDTYGNSTAAFGGTYGAGDTDNHVRGGIVRNSVLWRPNDNIADPNSLEFQGLTIEMDGSTTFGPTGPTGTQIFQVIAGISGTVRLRNSLIILNTPASGSATPRFMGAAGGSTINVELIGCDTQINQGTTLIFSSTASDILNLSVTGGTFRILATSGTQASVSGGARYNFKASNAVIECAGRSGAATPPLVGPQNISISGCTIRAISGTFYELFSNSSSGSQTGSIGNTSFESVQGVITGSSSGTLTLGRGLNFDSNSYINPASGLLSDGFVSARVAATANPVCEIYPRVGCRFAATKTGLSDSTTAVCNIAVALTSELSLSFMANASSGNSTTRVSIAQNVTAAAQRSATATGVSTLDLSTQKPVADGGAPALTMTVTVPSTSGVITPTIQTASGTAGTTSISVNGTIMGTSSSVIYQTA